MQRLQGLRIEYLLPAITVVLAIYGLSLLLNPAITWSNPEYLVYSVPGAMDNGLGFKWNDLLKAFDPLTFGDINVIRPRFLNYLITVLNVKFRLALYEHFIPPVNLSLMLLVHLVVSPLLLFMTARNLVKSGSIAFLAACLYMTSVGFLSTGVFFVQPGKVLIHPLALLLFWVLSVMQKRDEEKYFAEQSPLLVALVFGLNFIALSLDDTYALVSLVACVLFWRLFIPKALTGLHMKRAVLSAFVFFVPFLLFAAFVWKVAPGLSEAAGVGHCDYIGQLLGQSLTVAKTPLWPVFRDLSTTALASSLLVRPYPEAMSGVGLRLSNIQAIFVTAMPAAMAIFAFMQARKTPSAPDWKSNPVTAPFAALVLYFALQAFLQRFHVQITGSYYYASLSAIFVSIFIACVIASLHSLHSRVRRAGIAGILILMAVQLANFIDINQRWKIMHMPVIPFSLSSVRGIYQNVVTDDGAAPSAEQLQRMKKIWNEWKNGRRTDLSAEPKWPGSEAWFLIEMNALSGFVYRDKVKHCGDRTGALIQEIDRHVTKQDLLDGQRTVRRLAS